MWDLITGSQRYKVSVGGAISFSPDGKIFVGGAVVGPVILWDTVSGKQLQRLTGHKDYVYIVRFSPDGKMLASASEDKTVKLWDTNTGQELRTLSGHTDKVYDVAFSPNGKLLASLSEDKSIIIWDTASGEKLFTINGASVAHHLVFSADGKQLVILQGNGTIQFLGVYP
jgi:WD40 repeat protein